VSQIMAWFEVSDARLGYAGRIGRAPFAAWLGTAEGTKAIDAVASRLGFRLLGRQRAARREVWRTLRRAAASGPLRSALDTAADAYMAAMIEIAYAAGLPRMQVALRRVVVVPRVMIADRARTRVSRHVLRSPGMPDVDEAIRAFFLDELILQMDEGIRRARPSPSRPIGAPEQWTCVGVETTYPWVDPYWSGPNWFGHVFLYEWPPAGLARRDRKSLEGAIVELQSAINALPRQRRHELVRAAAIA
jgi:hypothetical protein